MNKKICKKKHVCAICNYSTYYKSHLEKHYKTKKHICKSNNKIIEEKEPNVNICKYCNKKYSSLQYLKNHKNICSMKESYIKKLENDVLNNSMKIDKLNELLKIYQDKLEQSENSYDKLSKTSKTKDDQYIKLVDKIASEKINRPNVYNYIVNNVKPTTNVKIELSKPLTLKEKSYLKKIGAKYAVYEVIYQRLVEDRSEDSTILVCFDPSRDKFCYLDENYNWITDFKLFKLINTLIKPLLDDIFLKNKANNYSEMMLFNENFLEYNKIIDGKNKYVINKLKNVTSLDADFISKHKKILDTKE
jgi:hypothetical protein